MATIEPMREAAGFILFTHQEGRTRYLLLRNAKHGTWSFPKGHLEDGEELLQGALRELEEETGITAPQVIPGFEAVLEYAVTRDSADGTREEYDKRTHLFLARAASPEWTRSPEHDDGDWMTAELALKRLRHADLKNALLKGMAAVEARYP